MERWLLVTEFASSKGINRRPRSHVLFHFAQLLTDALKPAHLRASHETAALLAERFKTFAVALIQLVAVDARQAPAPGSTAHIHGRDGRLIETGDYVMIQPAPN